MEGMERYELDALPWQGPRLGLDELQKPGEVPAAPRHGAPQPEHPAWKMLGTPGCRGQSRGRRRGPGDRWHGRARGRAAGV